MIEHEQVLRIGSNNSEIRYEKLCISWQRVRTLRTLYIYICIYLYLWDGSLLLYSGIFAPVWGRSRQQNVKVGLGLPYKIYVAWPFRRQPFIWCHKSGGGWAKSWGRAFLPRPQPKTATDWQTHRPTCVVILWCRETLLTTEIGWPTQSA